MTSDQSVTGNVRELLAHTAGALLIGPIAETEVIESAPSDTYLTGILWPRGAPIDASEDDEGMDGGVDSESEVDAAIPGYRAIRPCSIGITFAVRSGSAVTVSLGTTARYEWAEDKRIAAALEKDKADDSAVKNKSSNVITLGATDDEQSAKAKIIKVWSRNQLGYSILLKPESNSSIARINTFVDRQGSSVTDKRLSLHVHRRVKGGQDLFTITLINEEMDEEAEGPRDLRCLFQTEIVVSATDEGVGSIEERPRPRINTADEDSLSSELLYREVREFAVGHGIAANWNQEPARTVKEVRTSWMPETLVYGTSAVGHESLGNFFTKYPDALKALFLSKESNKEKIIEVLTEFAACYADWIEHFLRSRLNLFTADLYRAATLNLKRCDTTLIRIRAGIEKLKNDDDIWAAFALSNAAMDRQSCYAAKGSGARHLEWRPFQIAFILLVIPGLADPTCEDRECMDLLWFPTGGGKTEAYLALTAFEIFYKRITDASRRQNGGVDVLMRYTLRLLTVQQFQRAASLIAACEAIRKSDSRLGLARITIGLYVGNDSTPNKMDDARVAIIEELAGRRPKSTPRQLLRCPVCGSELEARSYSADPVHPVINIVCSHSNCESGGEPLPVITVDEAIYANPPSLLIGTIDKFAQIPRRTDMRCLFGLDGGLPPGLIIQDELHLISGPLGSMAGLYETVIDMLCTRNLIRPKVIGSTATIGHAAEQVRALFDRDVLQFPPPGFDAGDSFFAVRDHAGPDRLYLGIPTAGRSPKFALQALISALLQSASALREKGQADAKSIDPFWTCVAYFNSLRELGGADVLMQDDVPRQIQFLAGRLGVKPRELPNPPEELSSRLASRELPQKLHQLSVTLTQSEGDPFEYGRSIDTVLASNMISVGVDVPRLGLMVVNGQPKTTAEFIQASSRVGRGIPGLVVTLYNFGRARDLSHFEHYRAYHSALYRNVEATSVTPWAPRARDKALHAIVISVLRHLIAGLTGDEDAVNFDPQDPQVQSLMNVILKRVQASSNLELADTQLDLLAIVNEWGRRSREMRNASRRLRYWEKKAPFGKAAPHLMCSAEDGKRLSGGSLAWPTPGSLRDVEPSAAFILKSFVYPRREET